MSYIGTNKVGKMYLGDTAIGKAYLGDDLVYDSAGGGEVLPYDAEIEYLQSSGTQYIDTGVAVTSNNVTIKIKYQLVTSSDDSAIFGAMTSNNTCWLAEQYGNKWWIGTSGQLFSDSQGTTLHTVEWNLQNGVVSGTVDGINYSGRYNGTVVSGTNVHLFCTKQGANVIRESSVKIYYFSITDNGNEVLNMIPFRVGQVGYMYDKVSGQLFGNSGTGSFTLGNDVVQPSGGQYIQDNLVFHLDGINRGGTTGHWVDLVGGVDFALTGCTEATDHISFGGTGYGTTSTDLNYPFANYTMEIVAAPNFTTPSAFTVLFLANGSNNIAFSMGATGMALTATSSRKKFPFSKPTNIIHYYIGSGSEYSVFINGNSVSLDSSSSYADVKGKPSIGCRMNGSTAENKFDGSIYSIRVYQGNLTAEQRQQNLAVDNERFNMGLTL